MTFKQFLEQHADFEAVHAQARTQTIIYTFRHKRSGKVLTMECMPNQTTVLTMGTERRTIPSRDDVSKAYGRKASDMDMIRLFDQVLEKIVDRQKSDTRREIEKQMGRHARQQM